MFRSALLTLLLSLPASAETIQWIAPSFTITQQPEGGDPNAIPCAIPLPNMARLEVGTHQFTCPVGMTLDLTPTDQLICNPPLDANGDGWVGIYDLRGVVTDHGLSGFVRLIANIGREVCGGPGGRWLLP